MRVRRRLLSATALTLPLLLCSLNASAGDDKRRGTAGAAYLRVPATARLASLGTTLTAGSTLHADGVEVLFANPAALMVNRGTGVLASRVNYVADVGINMLCAAQQIGNNNLAVFVTAWDFGDIPRQTEANPEISDVTFSPTIITAGAAYARQFTDRIAAGVTVKLISEDIDDISGNAVAFDGGVTYAIDHLGLRFGFSVKNLGSKLDYGGAGLERRVRLEDQRPDADLGSLSLDAQSVDLPVLLNFGASYTREISDQASVSLFGNFRSNSFDQDQYAAGVELGLVDLLYVRGSLEITGDSDLSFFRAGRFGAGLSLPVGSVTLTADYAYLPTRFFSDVQVFTVGVSI